MVYFERKGAKYSNVRQTYQGYSYQSKKEAQQAFELDLLQKAGEIKSWERQKTLSLDVNGIHICNYRMDFVIYHHDGRTEFLEVKGFPTDVWKMKWKLLEALYGDNKKYKLTIIW